MFRPLLNDTLPKDGNKSGRKTYEVFGACNIFSYTYVQLVGFDIMPNCSMQDYGQFKIVNTINTMILCRFVIMGVS
jgi:hypothetical protein